MCVAASGHAPGVRWTQVKVERPAQATVPIQPGERASERSRALDPTVLDVFEVAAVVRLGAHAVAEAGPVAVPASAVPDAAFAALPPHFG